MATRRASGPSGQWRIDTQSGEAVRVFIPDDLPPKPAIDLLPLQRLLAQANQALGRLDGIASVLPETSLFLYMYVRKEALLSSQIEGTQSSLSDLLVHEDNQSPGAPIDDVREVSNYVVAMEKGLTKLRNELPLSLRLIREIHRELMAKGRGAEVQAGEFRTSQNWIGGTRPGNAAYVPPPPADMMQRLHALELFFHDESEELPILIKAAFIHVQFETIHPFLDGNGRLGRLLITFILCASGVLSQPLLYLSLYLKTNRSQYYALLQSVREEGNWEAWLEFFLTGVIETSHQAASTARELLQVFSEDRQNIEQLGRPASSALRVHNYLQRKPLLNIPTVATALNLSAPTIRKSVSHLEELGILIETTGMQRDKRYVYHRYLDILNRGTEPLG
jgi:Fic family protein